MSWSPAGCTSWMSHITVDSTPSSDGPHGVSCQSRSANLSAPVVANRAQSSSWSSASTFTQNRPDDWISGHDFDVCAGQNSTSGGSSDTEAKDWQGEPAGCRPGAGGTARGPLPATPT